MRTHHDYVGRSFDQDRRSELTEREPGEVWIANRERWDELQARIAALGYRTQALGPDYHGRVFFRVRPADG